MDRYFVQVVAAATIALTLHLLLARPTSAAATDYEVELQQIEANLAQLADCMTESPPRLDRMTRFVYRLYHKAGLTNYPADFVATETAIRDVMARAGNVQDFWFLKANLDFKFHRVAEASRDLKRIPEAATSAAVQTLQADIDLQRGRYDDARKGYETVIAKGRTWDRLARLAHFKAKFDDVADADRLYAEAEDEITAKEMRSFAWVQLQRGLLEMSRGRYDAARKYYERADRAYSGYWLIHAHQAELLSAERKWDEAIALYQSVLAAAARPELQQQLGELYTFMGQPTNAHPWYELALAGYLDSARRGEVQYYHHLAEFYANVRPNANLAIEWARKDLEIRPHYATQGTLAWALYCGGQYDEAATLIDQALTSGVVDAHLFHHAAMIFRVANQPTKGRQFLKRAAEINPRFGDFHVHR